MINIQTQESLPEAADTASRGQSINGPGLSSYK
jgi:hypothetical protein